MFEFQGKLYSMEGPGTKDKELGSARAYKQGRFKGRVQIFNLQGENKGGSPGRDNNTEPMGKLIGRETV